MQVPEAGWEPSGGRLRDTCFDSKWAENLANVLL